MNVQYKTDYIHNKYVKYIVAIKTYLIDTQQI